LDHTGGRAAQEIIPVTSRPMRHANQSAYCPFLDPVL
jgi:hypothetical protein